IQGYIMIINKLYEKDVKSINTKEFKAWTEDVVAKTSNNNEEIKSLVENIKNLPEEYNKESSKDSVKFLYNILLKYKVS
ncbi:MAG TPA: SPOR domain-containing protein, partial [Clostridium sp.]